MHVYGDTNIGMVRSSNQDAFAAGHLSENCVYTVLCDGVGGANGGQIASRCVVEYIENQLKESFLYEVKRNDIKSIMTKLTKDANHKVYSISKNNENLKGMGTTLVFAIFFDDKMYVVHIGDSRLYYIGKNDEITQITKDHSFVQEMIDLGQLSKQNAKNHPRKNYITRALGINDDVEIDFHSMPFGGNDKAVLCTDGLTNYLDDKEISFEVNLDPKESIGRLISIANSRGGKDNITVVVTTGC